MYLSTCYWRKAHLMRRGLPYDSSLIASQKNRVSKDYEHFNLELQVAVREIATHCASTRNPRRCSI